MSITDSLIQKYGETLTPTKAAKVLGCHPSHVRAMCINGELPAVTIGKRWFIPTAKLGAILDGAGTETKEKDAYYFQDEFGNKAGIIVHPGYVSLYRWFEDYSDAHDYETVDEAKLALHALSCTKWQEVTS